ncbi:MAG: hypothetical protein ACI9J2_000224 [Saprospiraceae bacterium]|jgi:hypothetical protein
MPLLFRLRNVPEDEAIEVRSLLDENDINYRETSGGFLGLGTAAIWVDGDSKFDTASQLLTHYQDRRYREANAQLADDKQHDRHETLWSIFKQRPGQFLIYSLIACGIVYLSVKPFFGLK